jgi:hypothetical protein
VFTGIRGLWREKTQETPGLFWFDKLFISLAKYSYFKENREALGGMESGICDHIAILNL